MLPPPPPISSQSSSFITSISHPSKRRKFQSHPYSHPHAHSNPRSLYLKQHSLHLTSPPLLKIQSRKPHTTLLNTDSKHHKRRRSSLSRRGLRALDSENLAAPHSSIPVHDFFRHISPNLSDVKRAKLLLLLCGAKVLQLQKKSKHPIVLDFPVSSSTPPKKLVDLVKQLNIELLRSILKDRVSLSWISNPQKQNEAAKLPNPINQSKEKVLKALKADEERLKREDDQWREIFSKRINEHAHRSDLLRSGKYSMDTSMLEAALKEEESTSLPPVPDIYAFNKFDLLNKIEQSKAKAFELSSIKQKLQTILKIHRQKQYQFVESEFHIVPGELSIPLLTALSQMHIEA